MCLNSYDSLKQIQGTYKSKQIIDSQKPSRKELKYPTKENYQTTKVRTKRRDEQRTPKTTGRQGLKWQ